MSAIIKIKRSSSATQPGNLGAGEMAYSWATNAGGKLYIGWGAENQGNAQNLDPIGGKYYTDLMDVTFGTTTASKSLIVDADKALDELTLGKLEIKGNDITALDAGATMDIDLIPKGNGTVKVPAGYKGRSGFTADSLVTKEYVDGYVTGLDVKESCRAASTGNVANLSNPGFSTLDGVSLNQNDRILLKDQTQAKQNGIYIFDTSSTALTRADDFNSSTNVTPGAFTFVEEGTVNENSGFTVSSDGTINVGTDNINFIQFSGAGAIGAGQGISKSGTTISVNFDNSTIGLDTSQQLAVKGSGTQYQVLVTEAGTASPAWGALPLNQSAAVTGTLGVSNGGTGISSALKGSVLVANTADTISALDGSGGADKVLTYDGTNDVVQWSTSLGATMGGTGQTSYTTGDLLFANSSTTLTTISSSGHGEKFLQMNQGQTAPQWTDTIDGGTFT